MNVNNNLWNYNISFVCTYKMDYDFDDDDRNILYQMQLLDALELNVQDIVNINIDEAVLDQRINELYDMVKDEYDVIECKKKNPYYSGYKEQPLIIFKMLFSYDEFDQFHKILCGIFNKKNVGLENVSYASQPK